MAVKTYGESTMTLDEIKAIDRDYLVPREVAAVLGCTTYYISLMARDHPGELGFPTIRIGNRTKIPKAAFINAMEGKSEPDAIGNDEIYKLFKEFIEFIQYKTGKENI